MEKANSFILSVVLQLLYLLVACIATNISTDQSALLALKSRVTLNSSHPLTQNWSSQSSVCDWIGVTCGSRHHRQLQLENNGIVGSIPRSIRNMTSLWILNFKTNNLTGVIPGEIGNLHKLEKLYLQFNELSGSIPEELFNISTLRRVSLSTNNLSGSLPLAFGYWPTNLQFLNFLEITLVE
uniref:Probable LRR receptor-like serine/threonine-protein kinase At4g26540 n=1 Tax=Nicotiana tabacum TaxID=4097 RepID=A0A1S4AMC3_TOBAC|nr:PREDICTED: probable LRR receptor-like serine/threonine-protein kinase At4g26540 [Nicotiana tabacum]